ncbi:MAG: RNA polymerase-binding protein DksA [Coxiella sp. (in: Bacteria)]|nr:MAG: RNA polymerase-binding protein DksA [Coxiella sp. (in: g-proteobacteria)]
MPKVKTTKKAATKKKGVTTKSVAKKTTKKSVKNAVKKAPKAKAKVTKALKKKTVKKKALVKKAVAKPKKSTATKKKSTIKAKKVVTAKKTPTAAPKKVSNPKSTSKSKKIGMTDIKIETKIDKPAKQMTAPPVPTTKEAKMLDATMNELEISPYKIRGAEDYMTDEQLEHFRKILLRWKRQLMEEVDSTMGHMQKDGLSFPDPVDRASQEEGFNLELRTRDRERKLIKKIESALDGIETGDYGFCSDCGADIGVRRLEARPTATKCIDCKTYEEIREKQAGGY